MHLDHVLELRHASVHARLHPDPIPGTIRRLLPRRRTSFRLQLDVSTQLSSAAPALARGLVAAQDAYRKFYSATASQKDLSCRWNGRLSTRCAGLSPRSFAARRGMHPMAGGFGRVARDQAAAYRPLRKKVFGIDQLSLPASLAVTHTGDRQLNEAAIGTA